ncbi:Smr/MutS family protein [Legionella dresdenensis]|uniref:Smr/MutS family protein n=1 Tax=Legionella dresdenensis TaxID=450200 RepID=A0ABV8CDY8_9GAMM
MSKKSLSDEDKALFRQAVASAKPLKKSKQIATERPKPAATRRKREDFTEIEPKESGLYLSNYYHDTVDAHTILSFAQHSIPSRRMRELRQGLIKWQGRLDLHGLRPDDAQRTLVKFIHNAVAEDKRCLLVIHGKGGAEGETPILKNLVNHWLKQIPQVLAFHSATPRDGGSGALYLLLKRNRDK